MPFSFITINNITGSSTKHAFGSLKPATSERYTSLSGLGMRFIIAVSCYEIYISAMNATARLADLNDVHYFNRVSTCIALSAVHSYDLHVQSLPILPCSCLWSHLKYNYPC